MRNANLRNTLRSLGLGLLACLCCASCATSAAKKRAYCGISVENKAWLVPDSPQLQQRIASAVSAQGLQSNLPGRKPKVSLLSVSENLAIVDAITLYSATGSADFDTRPLVRLFNGGLPAQADFGKREIRPR